MYGRGEGPSNVKLPPGRGGDLIPLDGQAPPQNVQHYSSRTTSKKRAGTHQCDRNVICSTTADPACAPSHHCCWRSDGAAVAPATANHGM